MQKVDLLIIGTTTESAGIGGVSIHVERLLHYLQTEHVDFDFCDYKRESVWKIIKEIWKHKVIHIHPSNPIFRLFLVCVSVMSFRKVIFTVHGDLGRFTRIKNLFDNLAVRLCTIPIVINQDSYEKAIRMNSKTKSLSAYIPPYTKGDIPKEVSLTIEKARAENKIIVSTNASVRSFTVNGEEVYGIDFLIDYFKSRDNYFFCVSDPSAQYFSVYQNTNLKNVCFITEKHSFYALMSISDTMIRATATDGDSLSIREGLDLGIKVIATDCVSRPKGVILFRFADIASLDSALLNYTISERGPKENVVEELINIYNSIL